MTKKILQISNDFVNQKIYINLVEHISERGYKQVVYVPIKKEERRKISSNDIEYDIKGVEFFLSFILSYNIFSRLRYYRKINFILNDIESKIDLEQVGLVHSHFLFSDGGVAYLLKKKYNIPYIVNVRASDIFTFFHKMIHLRKFGNKIMNQAEQVIYINHSYKEIFKKKYLLDNFHSVLEKTRIIPNAIEDKWFNKEPNERKVTNDLIKLIYVGRIIKRKKLDVVIKALQMLNSDKNGYNFCLEVVGDGNYLQKVKSIANEHVTFHGKITDYNKLLDIYSQSHIFVMPSVKETFGLVYIEALSQGLPIIYCKNEGVDGFFENGSVGYSVFPNSVTEVAESIISILKDYENISTNSKKLAKTFNWNEITKRYIDIYKEIL